MLGVYKALGAWQTGHFRLSSGLHSDTYLQSAIPLSFPSIATSLAEELVNVIDRSWLQLYHPNIVLGPAVGAIIIAHELARQYAAQALFAERVDDKFVLRRGFFLKPSDMVFLVEDVITTGRSTKELIQLATAADCKIVGIGCVINRSGKDDIDGHHIYCVGKVQAQTWTPEECPLCKQNIQIDIPGSRKI